MSDQFLLVPIAVEATLANSTNESFKKVGKVTPEYGRLPYSILGGKIEAPPFQKDSPLQKGAHLHFILPDALTHGRETEKGFDYPHIPNRWIVMRIAKDISDIKNPAIMIKSWLVESDYIGTDNKDSVRIATLSDPDRTYKYLGRNYPVDEKPDDEGDDKKHISKLTVFGTGDPAFSAYYPSCYSVLGFYDALDDIPAAMLTYVVMGFYAKDGKNDPLYGTSSGNWQERLSELAWETAGEAGDHPNRIVCHGMVSNLNWLGENFDYPTGKPDGKVTLSIGNSSPEALSALIANKLKEKSAIRDSMVAFPEVPMERLLNALQYESMEIYDELDGVVRVEDILHERSFSSENGGSEWVLRFPKRDATETNPEIYLKIELLLRELNKNQSEKDKEQFALDTLKDKLYYCWYTYLYKYEDPPAYDSKPYREDIKREFDKIKAAAEKAQGRIDALDVTIKQCKMELEDELRRRGTAYTLESAPSPLYFYRPKDPVFLFSGEGVKRTYCFGEDGRYSESQKNLVCRISDQTISGLSVKIGTSDAALTGEMLLDYCDSTVRYGDMTDCAGRLLAEALFLDQDAAPFLAIAAYKAIKKTYKINDIDKLAREIQNLPASSFEGTRPSPIALNVWEPSWHSLFLEWEIFYYPTKTRNKPDNSMSDWAFNGIDFDYRKDFTALAYSQYSGRTVITPHSQAVFKDILARQIEAYKDDAELYKKLTKTLAVLKDLNILAQSAGGFTDNLTGVKYGLEFPVMLTAKGLESDSAALEMTEYTRTCIDQKEKYTPLYQGDFHPIRSGFLKVKSVDIINTFGISLTMATNLSDIIFSESLKPYNKLEKAAVLPPKMPQASRLMFDWLNVYAQMFSPVCGYIIPNLLNRGLMVYDSDGTMLGSLQLIYRNKQKTKATWIMAPTINGRTFDEVPFSNMHLKHFVKALLDCSEDSGAFDEFLKYLDDRQSAIFVEGISHSEEMSILCGRPIAIARAAVALQLKGEPVYTKALENFGQYETNKFNDVALDITIGEISRKSDGLIGYYAGSDEEMLDMYKTLYAAAEGSYSYHSGLSGYIEYNERISLDYHKNSRAEITCLVEPMAEITIKTGILPVKTIKLPDIFVRDALKKMYLSFEVYPIISPREEITMPLIKEQNASFSYIYRNADGGYTECKDISETGAVFSLKAQEILDGHLVIRKEDEGQ